MIELPLVLVRLGDMLGMTEAVRLLNGADPFARSDCAPLCSLRFLSAAGKGGEEAR